MNNNSKEFERKINNIQLWISELNKKIEIIRNIILLDIIFLLIAIIFTR